MAKSFITDLSTTAASNSDIGGQGIAGSDNVSGGDNVIRNLAMILAKFYDDLGGVTSAGGTATAVTITAAEGWTAYGSSANQIDNGALLAMKMTAAATGAATLAVNGLSTKKIRRQGDTAIVANDWLSGGIYLFRYDTAYDSASGAWVLLNPNGQMGGSGTTLLQFRPQQAEPPSSNYAVFGVRNGHPYLAFNTTTSWSTNFSGVLPRHYQGNGLTVVIHWTGNGTGTNKVCFAAAIERIQVGTLDIDADSFASATTDTTGVAADATSGIPATTSIALTDGSNIDSLAAGEPFRLQISRAVAQANDTFANDAQVLLVEIKET